MDRWTTERASAWYAAQPWLVGCNFIPSTAINQLEMWQADTFDPDTIERELGWAAGLGMNTVRTYLHDLAWESDPAGFKERINHFLDIARTKGIRPILVFFDDCWNDNPTAGRQPQPVPGVHNSGWLRSPGTKAVNGPALWPRLERYVTDIVTSFGQDPRVLLWDLYNEPGNSDQHERSLPLLVKTFEWARAAKPSQPISAGVWFDNPAFKAFQTLASDVITFHNYGGADWLTKMIADLRTFGRPLICTEWMARPTSTVQACLPVFQRERVACLNWGLVSGKTNTIYAWAHKRETPGPANPTEWFHDLLRPDGSVYSEEEVSLFRKLTREGR
jgi:hypothetical protein